MAGRGGGRGGGGCDGGAETGSEEVVLFDERGGGGGGGGSGEIHHTKELYSHVDLGNLNRGQVKTELQPKPRLAVMGEDWILDAGHHSPGPGQKSLSLTQSLRNQSESQTHRSPRPGQGPGQGPYGHHSNDSYSHQHQHESHHHSQQEEHDTIQQQHGGQQWDSFIDCHPRQSRDQDGGHNVRVVHVGFESSQNMDKLMAPQQPQLQQQQQPPPQQRLQHTGQRLRQGSLASDWRFPSAAALSMHSLQESQSHLPPQSPVSPRSSGGSGSGGGGGGYCLPYSPSSPTGPFSNPNGREQVPQHHRPQPPPSSTRRQASVPVAGSTQHHQQQHQNQHHQHHDPWQAASSGSSPPSSPSTRRRRDIQLRQNTDPLVYHRFISSDPVHNTRTLSQQTHHTQTCLPAQRRPDFPSFSSTYFDDRQLLVSSPSREDFPTSYQDQDHHHHHHHHQHHYQQQQQQRRDHDLESNNETFATVDQPRHNNRAESSHEPPRTSSGSTSSGNNAHYYDRRFLPITPVSPTGTGPPRWDSLPPRSEPSIYVRPATSDLATPSTADALVTPSSSHFPPSPLRSPRSPTFPGGPYSSTHHPFIPEDSTLEIDYESLHAPSRHEHAGPVAVMTSGPVDRMYRPDSRQSGDTAYSAHSADNFNFSRPRKASMRSLNRPDFSAMHLRPGTARSTASDSLRLEPRTLATSTPNHQQQAVPFQPYSPLRPGRRPSASSNMSSSTFTSITPSLHHQASEDRLGAAGRNVSQNAATGQFMGPPHMAHPQAPPRYYNRGGAPAPNQQSHLYEGGEVRSSIRSHLTTSTAQETLFTEPERSSVMTKTSSVLSSSFRNTRQSSFFGPHNPSLEVRDSLSVDDVMGMYENGFNDSDFDLARRMSGIEIADRPEVPSLRLAPRDADDHQDVSRPGSSMSHNSEAASRLLEAMSQTVPMPIPGRSFPLNGEGTKVLRDTNAFFRKSLASSLPKDMRLSFISTRSRLIDGEEEEDDDDDDAAEGDGNGETDSTRHSRHDSGKMVEPRSEESSPVEVLSEKQDEFILTAEIKDPPSPGRLSPQPPVTEKGPSQSPPPQLIQGAAQPEDRDPNANDRYGFRKSNQYITRDQYDEWNSQYSEYLARRRKKWESFLKENGLMTDRPERFPQHSAKAKRFVRKGIPPDWRGAAWFYYAGGPKILAHNRGVYDEMVRRASNGQLKEVCRDDIERDLYRTFPDNVRFRRAATGPPPGQDPSDPTPAHSRNNSTQSANPPPRAPGSEPKIIDQLRRVLSAFAIFNPNIGYCQSLNFLGGMLLLFVETEEQAFWLLNIITRVYLPGTHEMNLEGSKVDLSVLMAELEEVLPNVWAKISDDGSSIVKKKSRRHRHNQKAAPGASDLPPVTLALTAWFMSCFIGTLPIETTLRVWDVFFYEGSKTLFRVALAIFKAGENEIKAINDPMEVFAVVQSMPRKMLDANGLMDICFRRRNGLNHLTAEMLDEQRAERKEKLQTERKEAMAVVAGTPGIQTASTMAIRRKESDMLTIDSADGVRRKHNIFSRGRGHKDRGIIEV